MPRKSGSTEWPALSYETRAWEPSHQTAIPRSQRRAHSGNYKSALVPEIATIENLPLSASTVALSEDATSEIARFDTGAALTIAPFTTLLLRSESASSSKIENLTSSARSIALAELGDTSKKNANIIAANTRAMEAAIELSNRLDAQAILDMQSALLGNIHPEWAGKWRQEQVWIGGSDYGPFNADFVPPHHSHLKASIDDLVRFIQRDDLPVLVQATIAHAQFETIHPFQDGNGRTGRSLIHALLRAKQITRGVVVPISAGLLADTSRYFDALTAYRSGDLTTIVELFANASFVAINNGRELVTELIAIQENWKSQINARSDSAVWAIIELLLRQPVINSPLVQRELGVSAANVNAAISHLTNANVIKEISGNYRNRKWEATAVLQALDSFAERAGRRANRS